MVPKGGYFGKVLEVNLTNKTAKPREISDETYRKYIGGSGLGAFFLFNSLKAKANPLAPEAPIFFGVGPLNGTYCTAPRMSVVFKSPHTGIYGDSQVGGSFSNELKWAGWDGILITGKSRLPVYLYIDNDKVEFKDARPIWGKDTYATDQAILTELKDQDVKVACIGPAGENQVTYAAIIVDRFRAAGRTGGGAVMGSKNLKAIAVKGTKVVPIAQDEPFMKAAKASYKLALEKESWQNVRRWGTAGLLESYMWGMGSLVTRNYQTTWYPDIVQIGSEEAERRFWKRHTSCPNCSVHCMKIGVVRWGPYAGLVAEGPEYESGTMLGSNLDIAELGGLMKGIEACDALGLDNISMGNIIGFAMELVDRSIITHADLDNIKLEWGDVPAMVELIKRTAYKKGKAGQLLSLGVKRMAEKIGKDADYYAIHVKGLELAAHDPRGNKARGGSYSLAPTGGCHHSGDNPPTAARWAMINSLVMCTFVAGYPWGPETPPIFTNMLNPLCGWNMKDEEFWDTAKRIVTLERCFNVREGISRKDDVLPKRLMTEKLPDGPKKGAVVTAEEMKKMQDDHYKFYGWDDNGIPTAETLKKLNLEFAEAQIKPFRKA
jgi:aldehyde:ferredoxin oxidoreductase